MGVGAERIGSEGAVALVATIVARPAARVAAVGYYLLLRSPLPGQVMGYMVCEVRVCAEVLGLTLLIGALPDTVLIREGGAARRGAGGLTSSALKVVLLAKRSWSPAILA